MFKSVFNNRLNNQFEREVDVIGRSRPGKVRGHYNRVAHWRIKLTDCQAFNFGLMNVFVLALMATALVRCCVIHTTNVGQIFAVFGYVMVFVMGLVEVPLLVQQFSRLRDIKRRMDSARPDALPDEEPNDK